MVQKTVPVCETQPHLHSTLPAVSGWLRLSMVVSFLLLAAINVLFMYGMLGRVDPAHLSYMQTPLMPQRSVQPKPIPFLPQIQSLLIH